MRPTSRSVPQGTTGALAGVTAVSAVLLAVGLVWPHLQNALVLGYAICTAASYVAVGLLRAGARRSARARTAAAPGRRVNGAAPAPATQVRADSGAVGGARAELMTGQRGAA